MELGDFTLRGPVKEFGRRKSREFPATKLSALFRKVAEGAHGRPATRAGACIAT